MRNRKLLFRRVLGLVLAVAVLLPLAGDMLVVESSAVTQAEIDALKGDANELAGQKKEIQAQIKALQADKSNAEAQRDLLEQQIYVVQQEINNINAQLDQLIAQKAAELAQAEADEAAQFDLFCRRMRDMEEEGETSYWEILFTSSDFADLLDNYMMIEEIIEYDNKVIDDLTALQEKVSADKAELETARAGQEAAKQQQEAVRNELKGQEAELDALITEINSKAEELGTIQRELEAAAKALDSEIKKLEREMAAQLVGVPSESGFLWPLSPGINTLSSLYGSRTDPISHKPGNHTGIDIPAPKNTSPPPEAPRSWPPRAAWWPPPLWAAAATGPTATTCSLPTAMAPAPCTPT